MTQDDIKYNITVRWDDKTTYHSNVSADTPLYYNEPNTLENKEVNIPIWLARNFLESTDVPRFKRILEEAILKKASEK